MNLYFLMGLETRQLDSVQRAPVVSKEEGGKKRRKEPGSDSDLFWTLSSVSKAGEGLSHYIYGSILIFLL